MKLRWSNDARADLAQIRRFSARTWGRETARRYLLDLRDAARAVAARPESARFLRGKLNSALVRSHILIIEIDRETGAVTIARVLHAAMDIERHLPRADKDVL